MDAGAESVVRFPVTIVHDREANLSMRVGGVVSNFPVRIGQRVERGQVIAQLDATPYEAARIRAEADLARTNRAVHRNDELLPAGAISQSSRDDMVDVLSAAKAALKNASYDETSALARAPFPGILLSRDTEVGEAISPGQRIARIADLTSPIIAKAAVSRAVAAELRAGARAAVFVDGGAGRVSAHVRSVGAASDPHTATVEVELLMDDGREIASGTIGSVTLTVPSDRPIGSQKLPAEALLDSDGGWGHVYVVDPALSTARRVKVRIDGFDGDWLTVEGIPVHSRVITAGAGFVTEGQKVAVASR
jgi:RND family efflux transporter MFP subunit